MASLINDGREIRQPENISLDSHKETTETQTVAVAALCPGDTLASRMLGLVWKSQFHFNFGQTWGPVCNSFF